MERGALELIVELRDRGYGWHKIADVLNARGIPTRSGRGQWHAHSVKWSLDPSGWAAHMRTFRAHQRQRESLLEQWRYK